MSPMWNLATRDDFRVVWCGQCKPDWCVVVGRAPTTAHRKARKHAEKFPGHDVTIIDLTRLEVEHRYQVAALPLMTDDPPF